MSLEDDLRKRDPLHQTPEEIEKFRRQWRELFPEAPTPERHKIPIGMPTDDENGDQHGLV
jgi:hypothetical protein